MTSDQKEGGGKGEILQNGIPAGDPERGIPRVDRLAFLLARVGPAGKSPHAPGTVGALVAAVAAGWLYLPLPLWGRLLVLGGLFVIGGLAATRVERILRVKDPGEIVLDEVLGQLVAYTACTSLGPAGLALGFLLFRIFDIAKPGPVRASELWLPSGWGVMIDDAIAGLFAMVLLYGAKLLWPGL